MNQIFVLETIAAYDKRLSHFLNNIETEISLITKRTDTGWLNKALIEAYSKQPILKPDQMLINVIFKETGINIIENNFALRHKQLIGYCLQASNIITKFYNELIF